MWAKTDCAEAAARLLSGNDDGAKARLSPFRARQIHKGQFALGDVLGLQVGGLDEDGHDEVGPR